MGLTINALPHTFVLSDKLLAGLPSRYWPKGSQTLEAVTISCELNTLFLKFRAPESRPKMHLVGDPLLEGTYMDEFPCTPQLSTRRLAKAGFTGALATADTWASELGVLSAAWPRWRCNDPETSSLRCLPPKAKHGRAWLRKTSCPVWLSLTLV